MEVKFERSDLFDHTDLRTTVRAAMDDLLQHRVDTLN